MSNPSEPLTVGWSSQIGAAGPEASAPRASPDVITYFYASRMVYVAPADTYDVRPIPIYRFAQVWSEQLLTDRPFLTRQGAIDIAKESFRELKDVDRDRISLEVHVKLSKERASTMKTATAEIGRSVWSIVVPSLARFEIVEIRVAAVAAPTGKTTWHFLVLKLRLLSHLLILPKGVDIRMRRRISRRVGHESQSRNHLHHHRL